MAFQPLLRHRALPMAALTAGLALYPSTRVYAEAPDGFLQHHNRKPIYDIPASEPTPQEIHATTVAPEVPTPEETIPPRSPTARLAEQIRVARLFLHTQAVKAEDGINTALDKTLDLENSFTSTLASLAPPKESGEKLLPGSVYVLVAAMAGSIVARNRNILLRGIIPVATGLTCAHYVIPITTRNVGNLAWEYEKKYPVLADNHIRARDGVTHFIETGKAHSQMGYYQAVDKVKGVRETLEEWVRKGR
ncbi:hypothetical protein AAFC00_006716 [Neodothiora populina]|uniref:MICOS complex subunit n=1 Tax=Neodothiora populina TaxID=2781224 RepID=A0ABR3PAY8_9PEZI